MKTTATAEVSTLHTFTHAELATALRLDRYERIVKVFEESNGNEVTIKTVRDLTAGERATLGLPS